MPSFKTIAWIVGLSALTNLGVAHYQARKES